MDRACFAVPNPFMLGCPVMQMHLSNAVTEHVARRRCRGVATLALAALAVLWAARTAARLFVRRSPALEDHFYLVAYPCLLMFSAFALLNVY
jgi:hypothetical protein